MMHRSGTELLHPFQLLEHAGIRERQRVADLGCGALGHFVFPAAEAVGPRGKVYAVDILRDALDMIARRAGSAGLENITGVWSDIDTYGATRIPSGELDLALLVNNLFLSKNRSMLAKEMARLTKPGGRVLLIDWKPKPASLGPAVEKRVSKEEAMKVMDLPEFKLQEAFDAGPHHYGLIFSRTDKAHAPPNPR